ncbi:MAG: hypothetical protein JWR87_1726 [Segetibacter sp.]|jgi:hypothetical protein|nr:hypothetical protein [Segetibacter sp.]
MGILNNLVDLIYPVPAAECLLSKGFNFIIDVKNLEQVNV